MISSKIMRTNGSFRPIRYMPTRSLASSEAFVNTTDANALNDEWQIANPFESVPRPNILKFLSSHLPGGRFHGKSMNEINNLMRKDYGDIFLVPGLFGRKDTLFTFNPHDFQMVFRTEGIWPIRRGLDIIEYFRRVHRPELFKESAGLVVEHGIGWSNFRSVVNPVLMNPKTFKLYTPKINQIADQFISRIKTVRDTETYEVPENFDQELNFLTFETVGVVALDTQLGLLQGNVSNANVKEFMKNTRNFFELLPELELKPSLWKLIATPSFKKFIKSMDFITNMSISYVEAAKERLKTNESKGESKSDSEKSFLERLIKTSPAVASIMAMDTILAGVDTTATAFASCLVALSKNPEKQQKLREEILKILPEKETPLTAEKMNNLPYLRACIKESLRLNPVTSANFRTTGQNVVLSGYRIPKDLDVIMPNQDLLRDEKNYVRAKEFLPERWLRGDDGKDENGHPLKTNYPFVFLPFGFGPRMCIGKRIVDLELEVTLAKLVRNFEIRFDYPADDVFKALIINVPEKPLKFKFLDLPK